MPEAQPGGQPPPPQGHPETSQPGPAVSPGLQPPDRGPAYPHPALGVPGPDWGRIKDFFGAPPAHSRQAKDPEPSLGRVADRIEDQLAVDGTQRTFVSGIGRPDPDGFDRTPGRTGFTLVQTPQGTRLLRSPAATLADDPAFKEVAESVRQVRGGDTYKEYQKRLTAAIKKIVNDTKPHALKNILEIAPNGQLRWKAGTSFAGQYLNFAHTLARQTIINLKANPNLAVAPNNLEPTGHYFHSTEYGHVLERITDYMRKATVAARGATVRGTEALALRRIKPGRAAGPGRPGQAGYIRVGTLVQLALLTGNVITILRTSGSRTEVVGQLIQLGTGLAMQEIVFRVFGGPAAIIVPLVVDLRSDDAEVSRLRAIDEARREFVHEYVDKFLPETKVGGRYDPAVAEAVYQVLFEIPPTPAPEPLP